MSTFHLREQNFESRRASPPVLSELAQGFDDGFWSVDEQGATVFANSAMSELLGISEAEMTTGSLVQFLGADQAHGLLEAIIAGSQVDPVHQYMQRVGMDGRERWLQVKSVQLSPRSEGRINGFLLFQDITDARLTASTEAYRAAIIDSSDDAIVGKNLLGVIKSWNGGAERLFGYSCEEALGQDIAVIVPADRAEEEAAIMRQIRQGARVDHFETVRVRKDGSKVDVSVTVSPIRNEAGIVIGASKVARDIGGRVRAFEDRALLAAIVESSDDAIISNGLSGTILTWNRGAEILFGYAASEAVGQPVTILLPPERHQEEFAVLEACHRGEMTDHLLTTRLSMDGRLLDVHVSVSPLRNELGEVVGAAQVLRDATHIVAAQRNKDALAAELERRVEERTGEVLAAARDMEIFAYGASHDMRAPLRSMELHRRILKEEIGEAMTAEVSQRLERQGVAIQQMHTLISGLLTSARIAHAALTPRTLDVSSMVRSIWHDISVEAPDDGRELYVDADMQVWGDATAIRFVFQNLLENAVKFSPARIRVQVRQPFNGAVTVQDDGVGFDMKNANHIFEPFHRLVSANEFPGTGLGLSNVKRLIDRHRGTITVESRPGKGTTFSIQLPTGEGEHEPQAFVM